VEVVGEALVGVAVAEEPVQVGRMRQQRGLGLAVLAEGGQAVVHGLVQVADDSLLFTSPSGSPLRHSNFRRRVWLPALAAAGLADVHFHGLRHAGNVLAAAAGANLRELMERMGHSTTLAAMIYLHSTDERQRKVADALGDLARSELRNDRAARCASGANLAHKAA
jgi:integrase